MAGSEKPAQVESLQLGNNEIMEDGSRLVPKQGNAADQQDMFRMGKDQEMRVSTKSY